MKHVVLVVGILILFSFSLFLPSFTYAGTELFTNPTFGSDLSSWDIGEIPTDVGGVQVWMKADEISNQSDGNSISSWDDLSPNVFTATQSASALQPVYKTNIINGKPVVRFSGTQYLQLPPGSLSLANNTAGISLFSVVKSQSASATQREINITTNAGADRATLGRTNGGALTALGRRLDANATQTVTGGTYSTVFSVDDAVFDYNNTKLDINKNGTGVATSSAFQTSGNTSATNSKTIYIGSDGTNGLNGDLAEVAIFNEALSATDRGDIEAYLGNKYGISLVSSPIKASRTTSNLFSGLSATASAKITTTAIANFTQNVNVGDNNTYTLSVYAYTNGNPVTANDLELYQNGATVSATFVGAGSGWYQVSANITGVASAVDYGVQIQANKTVYLDTFSLQLQASPPDTSSSSDAGTSVDPNFPSGWNSEIMAGPHYVGADNFISSATAPGIWALIAKTAVTDDLTLSFTQSLPTNLFSVGQTMLSPPINSGFIPISQLYNISAISAFNGYIELQTNAPYTLLITYDPTLIPLNVTTQPEIIVYNEATQTWSALDSTNVINVANKTVANVTKNFGYFAVAVEQPIPSLEKTKVLGIAIHAPKTHTKIKKSRVKKSPSHTTHHGSCFLFICK